RRARWEECDQVRRCERADGGDEDGKCRDHGGGRDAEAVGDLAPNEVAEEQSDWDPDDEPDGRKGRCLPCDGGADLPAVEPERLEDGEFASATSDARDQRMSHGE